MAVHAGVPQGIILQFTTNSADSKFYPGIAREQGTFGIPDPNNPARLVVTTSHPASYTRRVTVYVPKQYVPGAVAPFIVGADGPDSALFMHVVAHDIRIKEIPIANFHPDITP